MAFIGPLRLFYIRAQVRAYLLAVGEFQTFAEAFAPLLQDADDSGLTSKSSPAALLAIVHKACADAGLEPAP